MKNKFAAGGALVLLAVNAHAQSSVTLYGLIDSGITYTNHSRTSSGSSSVVKYGDGVAQGSRWGMKGQEDLGSGTQAIFTLENGFDSGTGALGQGSSMFGRQAFVGIHKNGIGQITFGRHYSLSTSVLGHGFSMGARSESGGFAYHINDLDQLTGSRLSNSVRAYSDSFYGLSFGAMYAFSNQAGAFSGAPSTTTGGVTTAGSSSAMSFAVDFERGPLGLAAAYTDIRYPGQATPTSYSTSVSNVNTNGTKDLRTFGVGARYTIQKATLWGLWTNTHLTPITGGSSTVNAFEASGSYYFTPSFIGALGYTFEDLSGTTHGRWNQVNTVLDYFFSKRTDVYLSVSYQKASGSNNVGGVNVPVQAQIGSNTNFVGISGGPQSQIAARVAMVHRF